MGVLRNKIISGITHAVSVYLATGRLTALKNGMCVCMYIYIYMGVWMSGFVCVCINTCTGIYINIYMAIYIYIYISYDFFQTNDDYYAYNKLQFYFSLGDYIYIVLFC